jgi:hypothetical protein
MAVLTEKILGDVLEYLEKSINNLATDAFDNLELEGASRSEKFSRKSIRHQIRKFTDCKE